MNESVQEKLLTKVFLASVSQLVLTLHLPQEKCLLLLSPSPSMAGPTCLPAPSALLPEGLTRLLPLPPLSLQEGLLNKCNV